jgi:type II secretory ATPase GspE/PulE/Tfp pilus assembly ATPase PilB-like protein
MSVLKDEYNKLLERYYNGCKYLENNRNEIDKYIYELLKIQNDLEDLLNKIQKTDKVNSYEITNGFK